MPRTNKRNRVSSLSPRSQARELAIGSRLGPYEILSRIGAGGMGDVYRASDTKLGRSVAIKVLPPGFVDDPERLARFQREARMLASLNHPNIVTIHSFEEIGGVHFLTMEMIEGQPLNQLIPKGGLPVDRILDFAAAISDALAAAHEKGIVHRDLKPANVMVTDQGRVKVLDFGLAKDIREANSSDATLAPDEYTKVGVIVGTPAYMSPEQIARPHGRPSNRYLLAGHPVVRDGDRSEALPGTLRGRASLRDPSRYAAPGQGVAGRIARRLGGCDPALPGEKRRGPVSSQRATLLSGLRGAATAKKHDSGAARAEEGFWVAVLPFEYSGANAEITALAEGYPRTS